MKNAINYYYNLNPSNIRQKGKNYYFDIDNNNYILFPIEEVSIDLKTVYELNIELLNQGFPCHQIVLNVDNKVLTNINQSPYVLTKIFVKNRVTQINDLLIFYNINLDTKKFESLKRNDWKNMWINKIDYFEYQINQTGKKYPLIRESFSYFIGLSETAIQFVDNIFLENNTYFVISHKRFKSDDTLFDTYNPFNFIIDSRVRDISEYYKTMFFKGYNILDDIKKYIIYAGLNNYECNMLFARMLFPTFYFDCYEEIIIDENNNKKLLQIINLIEKYEVFLKEFYLYLKTFTQMPDVEWIIKT